MTEEAAQKRSWLPLMILGAAQFIMVLDSSVMNVSISQIVADLDTTIQGVQGAITAYTLVMAAFMLVGAKLGDMYGKDRIFAIGLAVYGLGSLTTALSPNLTVLLFGWSLVEGLGAVMVIPAIAALVAANYEGKQRALAYGVIGGVAGAAIAAGPLIGGYVTTYFSWRWVFAGESVVVVFILLFRRRMVPAPAAEHRPKLDVVGAAFSAIGLGLIVFSILKASTWGWIAPKIAADDRRPRALAVRALPGPVPRRHRARLPHGVRVVGGAAREARRGRAARPGAPEDRAAEGGAVDARDDAARPARHVLRASRVSPGRARARRVRDRQEAVPHVRVDADRGAPRPEDGGSAIAAARLPGRPRGDGGRGAAPDGDDRRDAARRRLRDLARPVRHRRGSAHVAARQRDHVVRAAGGVERSRRPPGDGAEPRRVARHRPDRRHPAHDADEQLRLADRAESRPVRSVPRRRSRTRRRRGSTSSPSTRCGRARATPDCRPSRPTPWPRTTGTPRSTA